MLPKIVLALPYPFQSSFKGSLDVLLEIDVRSIESLCGRRPFIVRLREECTKQEIDRAISCSPEYIDIPSYAAQELFSYCRDKGVKTIVSYHDAKKTPHDLDIIFEELKRLQSDVIKIVTYATKSIDGLRLLELLQRRGKEFPMVAFTMGKKYRFSRVLQPLYNSLWTYACLSKKESTAEGQYTIDELAQDFNYTQLCPHTKPYACIQGTSAFVRHVNALFRTYGMNAVCVLIPLKSKEAEFYFKALHIVPLELSEKSALFLEKVVGPYVEVSLPPSKSQTLRAILFAACARGPLTINVQGSHDASPRFKAISSQEASLSGSEYLPSTIYNVLLSPDTFAMIEACRALGAQIDIQDTTITITGFGSNREILCSPIDAKNSGIVLRFIAAVAATFSAPCTIVGDESMKTRRTCRELLKGLSCLGADVSSNRDHVPITVVGPIQPGVTRLSGEDSQPVSALLIAASLLPGTTHIFVENPGEKPWVQLTLAWLKNMGISIENENYSHYVVHGGKEFLPFEYRVPGDLSSLGYIVVAALITHAAVVISNVDLKDPQGDKELLSVLERMGAHIGYDDKEKKIRVQGKQTLTSNISVDANNCIDMVTLLAVLGCFAEGRLSIYNCEVAKDKESNRLEAMVTELKKMGASIEGDSEHLVVTTSKLHGAALSSYHDHRVVMALKVAALGAGVECTFDDEVCVEKSFPSFFKVMDKINANNTDRLSGGR